jgi:hypothetical protein
MGRFSWTLKLGLELEQFNVKVTLTQQLCATAVVVDVTKSHPWVWNDFLLVQSLV